MLEWIMTLRHVGNVFCIWEGNEFWGAKNRLLLSVELYPKNDILKF